MARNDLTGRRFNRWLVAAIDEKSTKPKHWYCVCDCGTRRRVNGYSLTSGASRSCGCLAAEETVDRFTTHGMHKHPAYFTWRAMINRCSLPSTRDYAAYGGRGIVVCDEWLSFDNFWADMGPAWKPGLSIDRVLVNGNYERNNCRWATPLEQGNNRRNNNMIPTPLGPMTVSDAARHFGVNRNTINRRLKDGWARDKVLEPTQFHPRWHTKPKE